jgi:alpha-tubulin suppressor-like RCC1 family protein
LTNWLLVSASYEASVAIKTNGTLWTWGSNNYGQLGLGNTTNYSSPKQVGALTNWSKVEFSSSGYSVIAIKTDGTLWTWGFGGNGVLGLNNTTNYSSPKQIGALTTWSNAVSGTFFVLANKTDGTLWSWGYNAQGQLGLGNTTYYSSPKQIGALTTWLYIASCGYSGNAIKTDGTFWTWGSNSQGQLGLGDFGTPTNRSSPNQVGSSTTWIAIAGGSDFVLALG